MYAIKQYEQTYNQKINDFIESIYIDEFGYEEYRDIIKSEDNSKYINDGGTFLMALDESNDIIGTIAINKHSNEDAELKKLYVRKDYRGRGVSKALYEEVFKICKDCHYKKMFLGTFEKMDTAINFYINRRI